MITFEELKRIAADLAALPRAPTEVEVTPEEYKVLCELLPCAPDGAVLSGGVRVVVKERE